MNRRTKGERNKHAIEEAKYLNARLLAGKYLPEAKVYKAEMDGKSTSDKLGARLNSAGMATKEPSQTTTQARQRFRLTTATTASTTKTSN